MKYRILAAAVFLSTLGFGPSVRASAIELPGSVLQAIVRIECGGRQGTGSVTNGEEGYVLTNAHVVRDVNTQKAASLCQVEFMSQAVNEPIATYEAYVVHEQFDPRRSQDFAILQITRPETSATIPRPFPFLKTNEFSNVGDPIKIVGYSGTDAERSVRAGMIEKFEDGFIQITAPISFGDSGGATLDAGQYLIGMPTEIVTYTSEDGETETETYQVVDIRAVMNWLDTYGSNEHDKFFTHADFGRYHKNAVFINQTSLGCDYLARTPIESTVYCLEPGGARMIFPTEATFLSWFSGFQHIALVTVDSITQYTLSRNATFKPGTLVKSATSPKVFVVVDAFGTMRWIPSEAKARELWGPNWAGFVHDIPDEFFTNYTIGQPLDG